MDLYDNVGNRLKDWAYKVKNARGEGIATITIDAIRDLCGNQYFDLPETFPKYIDDFRYKEGALQSISNYRDHFIHPFHVFVLGFHIMNKTRTKNLDVFKFINGTENKDINLKVWFITSIYHDVGYPADKLEILVRDFFNNSVGRPMASQFDWSSVLLAGQNIAHIDALTDLFKNKNKDDGEKFKKWIHKCLLEEHDHGILSALMLCSQGWEEAELSDYIYESALAIALHNWTGSFKIQDETSKTYQLSPFVLEKLPLAFFLSFCDNAQEWGRRVLLERMKIDNIPFEGKSLDSNLDEVQTGRRIKVGLKYPASKLDIVYVNQGKEQCVRDVFHSFGDKFGRTWHYENSRTIKFEIEGKDKDGYILGSFGPLPNNP